MFRIDGDNAALDVVGIILILLESHGDDSQINLFVGNI